jgi:hypothetical protein
MTSLRQRASAHVALVTLCSFLVSTALPPIQARAAQPASPAPVVASPPAAKPAPAATSPDGGWPRDYTTPGGGAIRIFQPQVESWNDQKQIAAYSAVSYTAKGADKPALGTVRIEADTKTSVAERLVNFSDFKIAESNFPTLPKDQLREVVAEIEKTVPKQDRVIALDRVLVSVDKSQIRPKNVDGVKADPPVIFFSSSPAVLVNLDGDAIWSPIKGNDLKFAVNTNWDLFSHEPTKTFYLRHDDAWLAASEVKGPWKPAGKLPESFSKLPNEDNWKEVKASLPGKKLSASKIPAVFVSTTPAELLLLTGAPNYLLVTGTRLLWVSNTESDVFRLEKAGPVYYLVSGRWFSAPDFTGPWTFATPSLPEDFKKISLEHQRSRVLASVPGTDQAIEAVLLAQIPQTARVEKKSVKAPEVSYQGEPKFEPVEKTTVSRAVNTDKDIIKVGDLYYMCFQGVWFMAKAPTGPWEVTGSVPKQIYEIPVSSPSYNVTQVTVVEDDNDAVVFATAAAYTGLMIAWGCAVWGSGYYYPPYIGYGGFYPIYHPYYPTYGYAARYNPWTGTYGRGAAVYGPYGGAGVGARYNPRTGTYARGGVAYGPYGARGAAEAYNPRTGAYGATRQGSGVYGSWGTTGVTRGDDWAQTSRVTNRVTGNTTRVTRTDEGSMVSRRGGPGGGGFVAAGDEGNVYAGRDGNVYRKQGDSWQKYGDGGWNNTQQPTPQQREQAQQRATQARQGGGLDSATAGQLNRDSRARAEGAQRTRDYGSYKRSGAGAGTYRSGGGARGGARGGGRRR